MRDRQDAEHEAGGRQPIDAAVGPNLQSVVVGGDPARVARALAGAATVVTATYRTPAGHQGITFLLIDMETPGISTRPIRLISGASPFCETLFEGVRVPVCNVVGVVPRCCASLRMLVGSGPPPRSRRASTSLSPTAFREHCRTGAKTGVFGERSGGV